MDLREKLLDEITNLKYQLWDIDNEITEKGNILFQYNCVFDDFFGEIIQKTYIIQKEYYSEQRKVEEGFEEKYQKLKKDCENYSRMRSNLATAKKKRQNYQEKELLKKHYTKAALWCKPKIGGKKARVTGSFFEILKRAYECENTVVVKSILKTLEVMIFKKEDEKRRTIQALENTIKALQYNLKLKEAELKEINDNETYKAGIEQKIETIHFEVLKKDLANEYEFWFSKFLK